MFTAALIAVVGTVCATNLAIGFGFIVPVSSVFFVGLLDGE